ncbi:MAG: mechanosensitive ion channel family protein [Solirubrobacterales bacterium]|nr:mechanosensitive ion channel family protein [Solirubrobacterales bacterium]MCO5327075.1 mechanosensitive ion channel family protein [Solirubrobacterales bacterium]
MKRIYGRARDRTSNLRAFESRTQVWQEAGLGTEIDRTDARRARREAVVLLILIAGVLVVFGMRHSIFPDDSGKLVRYGTAIILAILGWLLARTVARGLAPALFRRMQPGTAGTMGFLIRLATIVIVVIAALRIAGVKPETLAVGGAFTAVVLGLAAQQTLAHVFAGLVLLTTRPFQVGDRVRLRGGSMAGEVEGIVGSLGLFYTTLISGGDKTMIPNNVLMQLAVIPISEPERVELKAKFKAEVTPQHLQRMIEKAVTVPLRNPPSVALEELDGDEVTVSITAAPLNPADGSRLASDVLEAVRDSDLDGIPDAYDLPTPAEGHVGPGGPSSARPGGSGNGGGSGSGGSGNGSSR